MNHQYLSRALMPMNIAGRLGLVVSILMLSLLAKADPNTAGAEDSEKAAAEALSSSATRPYQQPAELEQAWAGFLNGLQEAQDSLVNPAYVPPAPSDRVMAEGYRYLLGHLERVIDYEMRADPRFPEFFRSMSMLRKWTGENPDTMYLKAPIDASGLYRLTGSAANTSEWRTSKRSKRVGKAPRMVTFQTITDKPGDTAELKEMADCTNQTLDFTNGLLLKLDRKNNFSILLGPKRPADYTGDFLLTRKEMHCASTGKTAVVEAKMLAVREMFSDWENEVPLELNIERLDAIGAPRAPITPAWMSQRLQEISTQVPNQIRFWNRLLEYPMELHRDANGDGKRALPINGINQPAPPFTAGGVAGARQIYAAGVFDLEPEQALIVKVAGPIEPHYIGFQLNNHWMEGPDQQNYVSSLTGHQNPVASDGARYYIIAHRDPGYQGWVDTTGLEHGFHAMRFIFRDDLDDAQLPTADAVLTTIAELNKHLPNDFPTVSEEQRVQEVAVRQAHIKRRWRAY